MTIFEELREELKDTNLEEIGYTFPSNIAKESGATAALREIRFRKKALEACGDDEYKLEEFALKYFLKWKVKNQAMARAHAEFDEGDISDWCELVGIATSDCKPMFQGVKDCPLSLEMLRRAQRLTTFRGKRECLLDSEIEKKEEKLFDKSRD